MQIDTDVYGRERFLEERPVFFFSPHQRGVFLSKLHEDAESKVILVLISLRVFLFSVATEIDDVARRFVRVR